MDGNEWCPASTGYVSQVLDDARVYANYAKKARTIEMDDVKLAVHMQMEKSFTTPPPRDVRLSIILLTWNSRRAVHFIQNFTESLI